MPIWQPTQALAKPVYYDRQPTGEFFPWNFTGGPHAATVRATYTVPALNKAFIEVLWALALRSSGATTTGGWGLNTDFTPSGGASGNIQELLSFVLSATQLGPDEQNSFGYMGAGDRLRMLTFDFSDIGSVQYQGSFKGVQFPQ